MMHYRLISVVSIILVAFSSCIVSTDAHGCMTEPAQRGITAGHGDFPTKVIFPNDNSDFWPHFPAGDKNTRPGSGKRSQERAAGSRGWTLYEPMKPGFRWRAGVCGDMVNGNAHLRGGKYYNGGKVVRTYQQGGTVNIELAINAHHNGFIQIFLCNVKKCGDEISTSCFRNGHCKELERAFVSECQSGNSRWCGPIDPNYPGRFYLPCTRYPHKDGMIDRFGINPPVIKYRLPSEWSGDHFVLQWYWVSGNGCNVKGTRPYFTGRFGPKKWGKCEGQGGAQGGWSPNQKDCGGNNFPEEYLQCADIAIKPKNGGGNNNNHNNGGGNNNHNNGGGNNNQNNAGGNNNQNNGGGNNDRNRGGGKSNYNVDKARRSGHGGIRDLVLIGNGRRIRSLVNGNSKVSVGKYNWISIEAITEIGVRQVRFIVNGRTYSTPSGAPFYISGRVPGKKLARVWKGWQYGKSVTIGASARGDTDSVRVTFVR